MEPLFNRDELVGWCGSDLLDRANEIFDLETIHGYHLDRRGRIEAGVRPLAKIGIGPSFAKITRRGKRCLPECRMHGRGTWCIHSALLAVYHLGDKPRARIEKRSVAQPKLGFQLVPWVDGERLALGVKSLSVGRLVHDAKAFLRRNDSVLGLSETAVELVADLGEQDQGDACRFERLDAASILGELSELELVAQDGEPFVWRRIAGDIPQLEIAIRGDELAWQLDRERFQPGDWLAPGRPGFLIRGTEIIRYDYLPDFQFLVGQKGRSGRAPIDYVWLSRLCSERHCIHWSTPKPRILDGNAALHLDLRGKGRALTGRLGVMVDGKQIGLDDFGDTHVLRTGRNRLALLQLSSMNRSRLDQVRRKLRSPWKDAGFVLRDHQAQRFLDQAGFPSFLQVERAQADGWFGMTQLDARCEWGETTQPTYAIGGVSYSHASLMQGLLESRNGVRLADGQVLRFDTTELLANQAVVEGVRALHDDERAQLRTLKRLRQAEPPARPEREPTAAHRKLLRPYQLEGVTWMLTNHQRDEPSLLADDMGLGKTIQTLIYLELVRQGGKPQLLVVPTSLLVNWRREVERFSPKRTLTLHHGAKRAKKANDLTHTDLLLTTYGTVRQDIDLLYDVPFSVVVLDEAQAIKNPDSQTSQAVRELWADHRVALTGTPVENRMLELWSIFEFLAPGYLGPQEMMALCDVPGSAAYRALKVKTRPFILRRLKADVTPELPPKQETVVSLPLGEAQRKLYERHLEQARGNLASNQTMSILTLLLRLRQICCHPGLLEGHGSEGSAKFDYLLDQLESIADSGQSALVFSQFTQMLGLLRFELEERDLAHFYLDGATRDRHSLVDRFQAGERPIFLISLKAGGTGLNLTRASYVFLMDPWWNPMVEAQAVDRSHRIGQTRKVFSYRLVADGTIEDRILKLQRRKRLLAEGLHQDDEALLSGLNRDEIIALFT